MAFSLTLWTAQVSGEEIEVVQREDLQTDSTQSMAGIVVSLQTLLTTTYYSPHPTSLLNLPTIKHSCTISNKV